LWPEESATTYWMGMGTEARLGFGITRRDTVMANDEVGDVAQVEGAAAKGLRMGERRKCMPDHDATGCASWVDVGDTPVPPQKDEESGKCGDIRSHDPSHLPRVNHDCSQEVEQPPQHLAYDSQSWLPLLTHLAHWQFDQSHYSPTDCTSLNGTSPVTSPSSAPSTGLAE
jgi:hypothetical protein